MKQKFRLVLIPMNMGWGLLLLAAVWLSIPGSAQADDAPRKPRPVSITPT